MTGIETLEARIAKLEAERDGVKPAMRPAPAPYDYLGRMMANTPSDWEREAAAAVPTSMIRDIVNDHRPGARTAEPVEAPKGGGTNGWLEERPLKQPEGLRYVDDLAQHYQPMPSKHGG